jgi:hypothetical protein
VLCNPDEHGWTFDAVQAIAEAFEHEVPALHWSVANALGHCWGAPSSAPVLLQLAESEDVDVRLRATQALPNSEDFGATKHPWRDQVVQGLLSRMADPDGEVRDWATFGLGTQLLDDGAAVRSALLEATQDGVVGVRIEAACGLARRRDARATSVLLDVLRAGYTDNALYEAVVVLGDPALYDELRARRDADPELVGDGLLSSAISSCRPERRAEEVELLQLVLDGLQERLDAVGSDLRVGASCSVGRAGVTIDVDDPTDTTVGVALDLEWFVVAHRDGALEQRLDDSARQLDGCR